MIIKITANALLRIKTLLSEPQNREYGIRIGARGRANCGLNYYMGFQKQPQEEDLVYQLEGVTFFMDILSESRMQGIELDYVEDNHKSGFIFRHSGREEKQHCRLDRQQ